MMVKRAGRGGPGAYDGAYDEVSLWRGRLNRKTAPWGTFAVAHIRPPCASMIERQIDSPMPLPLDLVVKKALNSRSAFSAEIPMPQSVTLTSTRCVSSW